MAKLITLKESELFNMVKTIVEQVEMDLSQYDDNDFTDVFVFLFRNWISNKLGDDSKKYPFSFLLNKYGKEFLQDSLGDKYDQYYGDKEEIYFNGYNSIPRTGKVLVKSGAFTLPSLRQQEKFTEKYAKHLPRLIKLMRFPDFVRVEFEEEVPYDVHVKLYIDYPSYLRDESFSASHNLERKFKELLENYLGVDFGNPVHGKVNLTLSTIAENVEKWVKQVLNKEIKKHIKEMPGGKNIHSIRFEPSMSGSSEMKIVYKDGSHRHMHQWEFLRGVRDYINSLGYKRISADNA